jgi:hypothetical protein
MVHKKPKIRSIVIIILAWLLAFALAYIAYLKIKFLF